MTNSNLGLDPAVRRAKARRAALFWGLFLLALTSWPSPPQVPIVSGLPDFDKVVHGLLYGVEGFLLYRAVSWTGSRRFSLLRVVAITGALAVLGTLDEVHQTWIPGRSMEGLDAVMDSAGALLGGTLASALAARSRASEEKAARL